MDIFADRKDMPNPEKITSAQNPKIKNLKKLEKASERKAQNLMVIEGLREIVLAVRAGYEIDSLFICEELFKDQPEYKLRDILHIGSAIHHYNISKDLYDNLAYRESTEGIIATAKPKKHLLEDLQLDSPATRHRSLILVIEGVEKPGNLGAMLRTCDAAAASAVIICDPKTDVYNPNVIRSSIGTVFTNRLAVCESGEAISFLKKNKISILAAELNTTKPYYAMAMKEATAIVVGTEATGLSDEWLNAADEKIKIPMLGEIDSLNVSVSAAVLLFEAVRQRKN